MVKKGKNKLTDNSITTKYTSYLLRLITPYTYYETHALILPLSIMIHGQPSLTVLNGVLSLIYPYVTTTALADQCPYSIASCSSRARLW